MFKKLVTTYSTFSH